MVSVSEVLTRARNISLALFPRSRSHDQLHSVKHRHAHKISPSCETYVQTSHDTTAIFMVLRQIHWNRILTYHRMNNKVYQVSVGSMANRRYGRINREILHTQSESDIRCTRALKRHLTVVPRTTRIGLMPVFPRTENFPHFSRNVDKLWEIIGNEKLSGNFQIIIIFSWCCSLSKTRPRLTVPSM